MRDVGSWHFSDLTASPYVRFAPEPDLPQMLTNLVVQVAICASPFPKDQSAAPSPCAGRIERIGLARRARERDHAFHRTRRSRTHRIDRRPNWRPSSRLLLGDWSRTAQPVLRQGCTRTPRPQAPACPHAQDPYKAERDRYRNSIRAREGLCDQRRETGGGTPLTGGPRGWIDRRDHCRGERQCIICTGSGDRFEQAFFSNPAIVRQDACRDGERSKLISLVTMLAVVGDRMALAIDRLHPVPTNPLAF